MSHLFKSRFKSQRQDWETPEELFAPLAAEFSFTLDVAASERNAKASKYICVDQDALDQPWGDHVCWCNPPYGANGASLSDWVRKSHQESRLGATVVMLIPARTNTNWFHDICLRYAEVRFIKGRPKFGDAPHGLPQPLCLVIFRPENSSTQPTRGATPQMDLNE